jgi:hypothetical protein
MKRATTMAAVGVALVGLCVVLFLSCGAMPFDDCDWLPWCSKLYIDGTHGPSGRCQPIWED